MIAQPIPLCVCVRNVHDVLIVFACMCARACCREARLIKLADKYNNLRSVLDDPPVGWAPDRVQGYFLWAREVCTGCRGVNEQLERKLDELFRSSFTMDGVKYECTPAGEDTPTDYLERYYALLAADEKKGKKNEGENKKEV